MSQATSYYCNNVREGAAFNKLMARMLMTSRLRGGTCPILRRMTWLRRTWATRTVVKAATEKAPRS
jgi:hypothetical protein